MRAMLLTETGPVDAAPLDFVEMPEPEPQPHEIRVRVEACGVCRTDLHVVEGEVGPAALPLVPGHQIVGIVEQTGLSARRFQLGDRVGIAWLRGTCGRCDWCASGRENLCRDSTYTGLHADGGYADSTVVDEAYAYPLPEGLDPFATAPLLCAGIIGYRALERTELSRPGRLGLYGYGSSAALVARLAMHRGHEVYAFSRGGTHRDAARGAGVAWVGATEERPPQPLDAAIVFAPAGEVVPPALRAVDRGGSVVLAGIHMSPVPALDYESHLFHEKRLTSVEANTRADGEEFLAEAAAAGIAPVVRRYPLERANEALRALAADELDGSAVLDCRD